MLNYNKNIKQYSRQLRKDMTEAEKLVWAKIRGKQLKDVQFYRQKPLGNFIVDFYCAKANLVIELDGGQHFTEEGEAKDIKRDDYLKQLGLKVLRFSDNEVFENIEGIIEKIWGNLP